MGLGNKIPIYHTLLNQQPSGWFRQPNDWHKEKYYKLKLPLDMGTRVLTEDGARAFVNMGLGEIVPTVPRRIYDLVTRALRLNI